MALEPITRQEKIIAGQDLTPITRMEMFLKQFGGGGGGGLPTGGAPYQQLVTDGAGNAKWEDRLAYSAGAVISWDGDTTGKTSLMGSLYKVSDLTPTAQDIVGGTFKYAILSNRITITQDMISDMGDNAFSVLDEPDGEALILVSFVENYDLGGVVIPEKGIYLIRSANDYIESLTYGDVKQLDSVFIPPMDEIILKSSTPSSTKKFRITVEDSGVITATELSGVS